MRRSPQGAAPQRRPAKVGRRAVVRRNVMGLAMLAPQSLGYAAFGLVPLGTVFWLSLHQISALTQQQTFVGWDNYERLLTKPANLAILARTGVYVALLSSLGVLLALILALLVNQKLRGIVIFRVAYFLPALVTLAAWAIVWGFVLQPEGLADAIVGFFGAGPIPWLRDPKLALVAVVVVQVLKNVGINMMILLAALQTVPDELVDAAQLDGASQLGVFRQVTLPHIAGTVLMVVILMVVGSFKVFEQILLLTNGGPGTSTVILSFEVYRQAFVIGDVGYASALATLLFFLILVLTALVWSARRRFVYHEA